MQKNETDWYGISVRPTKFPGLYSMTDSQFGQSSVDVTGQPCTIFVMTTLIVRVTSHRTVINSEFIFCSKLKNDP